MIENFTERVLNGGFNVKLYVPATRCDRIETQIDQMVNIKFEGLNVIGFLRKVTSSMVKPNEENAEKDAYKCLDIDVESILKDDDILISFPDKKTEMDGFIEIKY